MTMATRFTQRLKPTSQDKRFLAEGVDRIKTVTDFLADAIEGVKDTDFPAAVAEAAPWAGLISEAVAEAVPPIKFVLKLYEKLTKEHDPLVLGYFACTLAYQRAVEESVAEVGRPEQARSVPTDTRKQLEEYEPSDVDLSGFSLGNALEHDFVGVADRALLEAVRSVGYSENQITSLVTLVHERFVAVLKELLTNGQTAERFRPFKELMELDTGERQAYNALYEHARYQRWLFEEKPVFEREPFALKHVYIDTECGKLTWSEIRGGDAQRSGQRVDAFSEQWGGRHPLLEQVLDLIADPGFRDAIVIQGVAGAGKSAFTLRLCVELLEQGLRPIRVRLRDLRLDVHVKDALPKAVRLDEEPPRKPAGQPRPDDLFLDGRIFKSSVPFRGHDICPYVLILDGWDEISIASAEDFKSRVSRMLEQVRSEYLSSYGVPVRVILTGRPSNDVSGSNFLRDRTPVLTVRPLRPEQLRKFVQDLSNALAERPVPVVTADEWRLTEPEKLEPALVRYEEEFAAMMQAVNREDGAYPLSATGALEGSMEVLGLPLLAHLAVRLISGWKEDTAKLLATSTTLYRFLVDLTVKNAGKSPHDNEGTDTQARISGEELRDLLRRTAVAMTILFQESISDRELSMRLDLRGDELDQRVSKATADNVLSELMISFYFKGGHPGHGCEFLHKSFREYLFAEEIVETLKAYGRSAPANLSERQEYWKDFAPRDPRYDLSRKLGNLFGPGWITPEVASHLRELITWEISRSTAAQLKTDGATDPLDLTGWERVRDGLADLWDWWGEGVHLRPQPPEQPWMQAPPLFATEVIQWSMPMDPEKRMRPIEPKRTASVDAHLGDGLFRLCAPIHFDLAVATGWLSPRDPDGGLPTPRQNWEGVSSIGKGPRRCQASVQQEGRTWTLFAPSGKDPSFFANYGHRINGAGWRLQGDFPGGMDLSGTDLRGTRLLNSSDFRRFPTIWSFANLLQVNAVRNYFVDHELRYVLADHMALISSVCTGADFTGASLYGSDLALIYAPGAKFDRANLAIAGLEGGHFVKASFAHADLRRVKTSDSDYGGADFHDASFLNSKIDENLIEMLGRSEIALDAGEQQLLTDSSPYTNPQQEKAGGFVQLALPGEAAHAPAAAAGKLPWPGRAIEQIGALKSLVAAAPAGVDEAAAAFGRAPAELVRRHLETLVLVGEVRQDEHGRFAAVAEPL